MKSLLRNLLTLLIASPYLTVTLACYILKQTVWTATSFVFWAACMFRIFPIKYASGWEATRNQWRDEWDHDMGRHL